MGRQHGLQVLNAMLLRNRHRLTLLPHLHLILVQHAQVVALPLHRLHRGSCSATVDTQTVPSCRLTFRFAASSAFSA